MSDLRDKGSIGPPGVSVDSKVVALTNPVTGYLYMVFADLPHHTCYCWSETNGWLPPVSWSGGNLLGWDAVMHFGVIKLCGRIWPEVPGGDIEGNHAVVTNLWTVL